VPPQFPVRDRFQDADMAHTPSRYQPRPKAAAPSNPIVLGRRATAWLFWITVGVVAALIVGSVYWLLTHSAAT
jgi:hypothetical protein